MAVIAVAGTELDIGKDVGMLEGNVFPSVERKSAVG